MRICCLMIVCLIPSSLLGQANNTLPKNSCSVSPDEIYSIINIVIKKEKINKSDGIDLRIQPYFDLSQNDTAYLKTFLIKPKKKVKMIRVPATDSTFAYEIPESFSSQDKGLLTNADIEYMLCTRAKYKNLRWDNSKLGFSESNKKNFYIFSLPYFNKKHDLVLLSYDWLCPGLCGSGKTIVLKKKGNGWDISSLNMWFH